MPILHRNIVPNVPAWTADNGKIIFRNGKPSHRAEMHVSGVMTGTVTFGAALTSLGFPSTVSVISSGSGANGYRYNSSAQEVRWGNYGDREEAHTAYEPGSYVHKFHMYFSYDNSYLNLGYLPAVFPDMEHVPDDPYTFVCVRSGWRFCHDWDASKAYAKWHGWPMEYNSFWDRWPSPGRWVYGPDINNPFFDPAPDVIVGVFQTWSYEDEYYHTVTDYVLVAGAACGANSARSDFILNDTETWPTDGLRIGTRRELLFGGVQDLYNLANIDLEITLAAAYA